MLSRIQIYQGYDPMKPTYLSAVLAAALSFGVLTSATAQETTTEAPVVVQDEAPALPAADAATAAPAATGEAAATAAGDQLSLGKPADAAAPGAPPADGPGSIYVASTHGDWELRCLRAKDGSDPCQLYQLLKDAQGNSVAEFSLFPLPEGQPAIVGATFVAPLETLLTEQLRLQVDGGNGKVYPFTWCDKEGCIARIGLTSEEVEGLKAGNSATATIVPVVAPTQTVVLTVSLKGFTAGYDALKATAVPK
jgi:invasion protein IalB